MGQSLFTSEQVLAESKRFLQNVGYQLQPISYIGFVQPDFHAKRQAGSITSEVIGMVLESLDNAVDAFIKLAAMKAVSGESADYVLVLPPLSEYLMIEFLTSEQGRLFTEIKQQQFMIWLCNPERETMTCLIGSPRDKLFGDYFTSWGKMSFDQYIVMRLSQQLLLEEE